jgi:aldehyde:ferredoxin oxidoreductase
MCLEFKGGYAGQVLEVDLTDRKVRKVGLRKDLASAYIGGRGFTSRLLYEELNPDIDPFSPENPLIFATGPLTGTLAPSSCRYLTAARSPLTHVLGDSNSGGHFGPELKRAGYDIVIVRGKSDSPVYLWIDDNDVEIRSGDAVWGKDVRQTDEIIKKELGDPEVQLAIIGQAGENLVAFAGVVANLDHLCGRTGMGAVMGSKKLKAVAVRGTREVPIYQHQRFVKAVNEMMDLLKNDHQSFITLPKYGTTYLVDHHNTIGGMATRNWQTGVFEKADMINGDAMRRQFFVRNIACWACPYPCDRYSLVKEGEFAGAHCVGPEYFTIVSFGSKCSVSDAASIVRANELANMYGLDSASTGGVIGFLMECYEKGIVSKEDVDGLDLSWGNYHSMIKLIEMIAFRKGIGDLLANGIRYAAEKLGKGAERYAIHVKGMDAVTLDPRALKVYNFRYAVASRGADHLRISTPAAYQLDEMPIPQAAAELKFWQDMVCIPDLMGLCKFPWNFFSSGPEVIKKKLLNIVPELYSAATGVEIDSETLLTASERTATTERALNVKLGVRRKDDTLPRRFLEEPLPEGPKKGQVHDILEPLLDSWYEVHGWDVKTGIPAKERLQKLGLKDIAADLTPIYEKEVG